jgi:flagellar basal-body rod modification protein FlgD
MASNLSNISAFDPTLGQKAQASRSTTASASSASSASTTANDNGLNSNSFLQLLVAQLEYQDPLNGMDTNQFMQQLSTMASMQQQQTINTNLASLVNQSQISQAAGMIGATVSGTVNGSTISGQVTSVVNDPTNGVELQIGSQTLPYSSVTSVQ